MTDARDRHPIATLGRWAARVVAGAIFLGAAAASAHNLAPAPNRELIRVQGYKAPAPAGVKVEREVVFQVLGQSVRFAVGEWRAFSFAEAGAGGTPAADSAPIALQGERALLYRLSSAAPNQRVTLLADRRPGSSELFVLAVDRCPE